MKRNPVVEAPCLGPSSAGGEGGGVGVLGPMESHPCGGCMAEGEGAGPEIRSLAFIDLPKVRREAQIGHPIVPSRAQEGYPQGKVKGVYLLNANTNGSSWAHCHGGGGA